MKQEMRFAIVGCGKVARRHIEAIQAANHARLIAVVDINPEVAKDFASQYGISWYPDIERMLSREDIDVVTIATPSGGHYAQCMEILEYGKDMVVEKPITLRLSDADHLLSESIEKGVNIIEVKQYRFHPVVQKLRDAMVNARLGRIVLADAKTFWCRPQRYYEEAKWRGTWGNDGGVFMNQAIHHIDLLQWLVGPVESVYARGATMLSDIEAEDVGCAFLKFTSGAMGIIEATTCARPKDIESSLSVLGEKGSVVLTGNATNQLKVWNFQDKQAEDDSVVAHYSDPVMAHDKSGHVRMYQEIINCLRQGLDIDKNDLLVSVRKARMCIELMHAIYESIETEQEVPLRHFTPRFNKLGNVYASAGLSHAIR